MNADLFKEELERTFLEFQGVPTRFETLCAIYVVARALLKKGYDLKPHEFVYLDTLVDNTDIECTQIPLVEGKPN